MNTLSKRIISFILVFFIIIFLLPQKLTAVAATSNAAVYEYSPMLEDGGNIYYIQTLAGKEYTYDLYRLEVTTGTKTRLLSSKTDILGMMLHDDTLYYTSYEEGKDVYQVYAISIDTKEIRTICNGYIACLDDSSIYYTVTKGEESKLYKRAYDSNKATLIYTGNATLSFVKSVDGILYFTQFKEAASKLTIYILKPEKTKLEVLTTDKLTLDGSERTYPTVSDLININRDIYYQIGAYEGTGNYWYGTLRKLSSSGTHTKTVIAKQLYEEQIYHNDSTIFYNGTDSSEIHYKYNTATGKTSTYKYKITGMESFNIMGDKTYCTNADGKEWITVSRFTSGTNQKGLNKSFIKLSYLQDKKYEYSAKIKKYGDYLLIPVTCMDYNDTSYSWRGRFVSVTWFVVNSDGTLLTQFQ